MGINLVLRLNSLLAYCRNERRLQRGARQTEKRTQERISELRLAAWHCVVGRLGHFANETLALSFFTRRNGLVRIAGRAAATGDCRERETGGHSQSSGHPRVMMRPELDIACLRKAAFKLGKRIAQSSLGQFSLMGQKFSFAEIGVAVAPVRRCCGRVAAVVLADVVHIS